MTTYIGDWVAYLRGCNPLMGLSLLAGGLGLMLFGWRMWKLCVVVAFGLIGMAVGAKLVGPGPNQALYAVGCGLVLGALSYKPANYSLAALGGLVSGGFVVSAMAGMGLTGPVLWIGGGVALFACAAVAFLNRQFVVIAVTAFIGAMLLVSGLAIFAMSFPTFYATVYSMAKGSMIVLPFLLLVPTVMSCFYQVAEVHRINAEM